MSPTNSVDNAVPDLDPQQLSESLSQLADTWVWPATSLLVVIALGLLIHWIVFRVLRRLTRPTPGEDRDMKPSDHPSIGALLVAKLRRPTLLIPALLGVQLVSPSLAQRAPEGVALLRHANAILLIVLLTWLVLATLAVISRAVLDDHDTSAADNLEARRVHTQLSVLRRVFATIVIIVGGAAVLMTFPSVRQFGASLLASAGLAGLVLGLAARPVLENLFAGVQVALTQPIRLDDVVVIDGEWGRIEEITTTYVVVRIWDQRRLILPFSRILAQSFQNWTRTSADILGTATISVDYTTPVAEVRAELERIVKDHPKWDKRTCGLQVTEAGERTMTLRALVSCKDSGDAWDLRCDIRERLIDYLQREHPGCLPKRREVQSRAASEDDASPKNGA